MMPMPSVGGKMNPESKRIRPTENPAIGPAAATFKRSSRFGTIFTILVIAPKEPICHQNSSLDMSHMTANHISASNMSRRRKIEELIKDGFRKDSS